MEKFTKPLIQSPVSHIRHDAGVFPKHAAQLTVYGIPSYPPDYNPVGMVSGGL